MTTNELWDYFISKQIHSSTPFDRCFVWISDADFTLVENHFKAETNLFHPGYSLRSKQLWRHVHVLKQGTYIHAHLDTGNVTRSYLLCSVPHLVFDVMPYLTISLRRRVKMASLFTLHNTEI